MRYTIDIYRSNGSLQVADYQNDNRLFPVNPGDSNFVSYLQYVGVRICGLIQLGVAYFVISEIEKQTKSANPYKIKHPDGNLSR